MPQEMEPFSIPVPMILEQTGRGERVYDIYSKLLKDRIVLIGTPIIDAVANSVVAQLLYLEGDDPDKPITLYLNTPGGSISAGLAIYDTMQYIRPPVSTICFGMAASMGAVLLAGGAPKKRFALPNSKVLLHQPIGGAQGQASDIEIQAKEILKSKDRLYEIIAKHTGKTVDKIKMDADRDFWLNAAEAKDYGLIDDVFSPKKKQ